MTDHNAARWLKVVYHPGGVLPRNSRGRGHAYTAGWYVIRTCPCHHREPVTEARDSREAAERSRDALVAVSERVRP